MPSGTTGQVSPIRAADPDAFFESFELRFPRLVPHSHRLTSLRRGRPEREQPCDHEVRRADQEDETDDGTMLATVRLRDAPDESLPDYRSEGVLGCRTS